jgi:mRNA interferase MazF
VSSQLHQAAEELDETISESDGDFVMSGLKAKSLIRLGYLIVLPQRVEKAWHQNAFHFIASIRSR